jgi:ATP-dependent exoDNAse (exonuclease V) beta subunit
MVVGGTENYFTRLEVRDLSNILTALANPEDEYAVLASLAGFACGLSPDGLVALGSGVPVQTAIQDVALESPADQQKLEHFRRWFLPLSKRADRMSAWEVLGEVFAQSPLLSRAAQSPSGDQLVANMRKLLSMATARPELGPLAFARQIESVRDLKSREGDAPIYDDETVPVEDRPVQIMTIHKSKGLEFDCVVIAQTEKAYVRAATNFLYEMRYASAHGPKEKRLPILSVALQGTNVLMHACLRTFIKQKALLEGRRLTYVAVTRARTKLIAEMNAKARSESASKDFLEFISRSRSVTIRDLSIGDADEAEISVPSEE